MAIPPKKGPASYGKPSSLPLSSGGPATRPVIVPQAYRSANYQSAVARQGKQSSLVTSAKTAASTGGRSQQASTLPSKLPHTAKRISAQNAGPRVKPRDLSNESASMNDSQVGGGPMSPELQRRMQVARPDERQQRNRATRQGERARPADRQGARPGRTDAVKDAPGVTEEFPGAEPCDGGGAEAKGTVPDEEGKEDPTLAPEEPKETYDDRPQKGARESESPAKGILALKFTPEPVAPLKAKDLEEEREGDMTYGEQKFEKTEH